MNHNLVVTYDLFVGGSALSQGKNYAAIEASIKRLGRAVKVNYSVWIVSSPLGAEAAIQQLQTAADKNDKIFVADATKDVCHWTPNYSVAETSQIKALWENKYLDTNPLRLPSIKTNSLASLGLLNYR